MTFYPAYWNEPEKTDFESRVKDIDGNWVELEETYFHPEGGGQPADKGTIEEYEVEDIQFKGERIIHKISNHNLSVGDVVKGSIDKDFRKYCMRCHTGSHVVYGAARKLFGKVDYSGFEIGEGKVRIDFKTKAHIDKDSLLELERLSNEAILESLPISFSLVDRDKAESIRELAFAKEMPDQEEVRVVEIEGWDKATCSGTHLKNTIDVGRIHVIDKEKLQEGVTRVNFSVGKPALSHDIHQKRNLLKAEDILETNYENLYLKIRNLLNREKEMNEKIDNLEEKALKSDLSDLDLFEGSYYDVLLGSVSTENTEMLSHLVKDRTNPGEIIIVVNERDTLSAIVSVGEGVKEVSAGDLVQAFSDEYGGGGGGTKEFAQGGGFNTNSDELLNYSRNLLL